MSTRFSREITYRCMNDCRQSGCPGHTMQIAYHGTSDTVGLVIDGREELVFDEEQFFRMCDLGREKEK